MPACSLNRRIWPAEADDRRRASSRGGHPPLRSRRNHQQPPSRPNLTHSSLRQGKPYGSQSDITSEIDENGLEGSAGFEEATQLEDIEPPGAEPAKGDRRA